MTSLQQTAMLGGAANAKVASYILVAADAGDAITMSNASATTITVNTGLFAAGDIVTIINLGAGICTITAGTATVATSGSLALAQNQGGVLRFTSASESIFFQFATPASGDIEGVTAGVGISGGGTSGTVTITNSMATAITTKGDLIVGTGSGTFVRQGIGTDNQVLTADSAEADGLKWATVSGGYSNYQTFTSSTTWTVPAGITRCAVYMVGGGGGGCSGEIRPSTGTTNAGGGGGGGAIAFDPFYTVTPAASITVTIGGGGSGGAINTSTTANTGGNVGTAGTATSFDGNTVAGGTSSITGGTGGTTFAGFISGRVGGNGANEQASATFTTVRNMLNAAGSLGSNGGNGSAGTLLGTGATATNAGFGGGGGGGQVVTNSTTLGGGPGAGVAGGGAGGAAAVSNSNITTTAGAGGNAAANRGGGGGGSGSAEKVGTGTNFATSPAAGNGGSGIVIIFY
jgi:hypothetical protein